MDYFAYSENTMVRSNVVTGSMAVNYEPKLVKIHAVARDDDGHMRHQAECGLPARFAPEEANPRPWDAIQIYLRCLKCALATGVSAADKYTGESVQARQ
jgi:hypothetical protein